MRFLKSFFHYSVGSYPSINYYNKIFWKKQKFFEFFLIKIVIFLDFLLIFMRFAAVFAGK